MKMKPEDRMEALFQRIETAFIFDLVDEIKRQAAEASGNASQTKRVPADKQLAETEKAVKSAILGSDAIVEEAFEDMEYGNEENAIVAGVAVAGIAAAGLTAKATEVVATNKAATKEAVLHIAKTSGVLVNRSGTYAFESLTEYYNHAVAEAVRDIARGEANFNKAVKKIINEVTGSGLRCVNDGPVAMLYDSDITSAGTARKRVTTSRIAVAARRSVMTGLSNMTRQIAEKNAELLDTEYFEVSAHSGCRPSHAEWQGKVYTKEELRTVCGMGTVTGLYGANCHHHISPFTPGSSTRTYTDEELEQMIREDNRKRKFKGKEYTKYEAIQKQRQYESNMRIVRERMAAAERVGLPDEDITILKARYKGLRKEYKQFSDAVGEHTHYDRVTIDGLGRI